MKTWAWDDARVCSTDFETSGTKPEFALQPWRLKSKDFWATSLVWVWPGEDGALIPRGGLDPDRAMMRDFLQWAISTERRVCGWNLPFDISVFLAYGLDAEVFKLKWLDGMLLWRHLAIEPEYDDKGPKQNFGLKEWVRQNLPEHAGYEEEIDYHDPDPAMRAKLHIYNIKDNVFTLRACKRLWNALEPRQQAAALIEADSLPMAASANLRGLVVDTLAANDLKLKLRADAEELLGKLAPHGVTEQVVRSPMKLANLLFDQWGLPVLKQNPPNAKGERSRSTDKTVLHELAFMDPRAKQLRSYREALNQAKKFAEGPIEAVHYCDDHGRAHPLAHVFGTYTGRFTYGSKQYVKTLRTFKKAAPKWVEEERPVGFALHQMKRGPEFRGLVVAPPGYTIVEFDASGQEFRWMAIASGDEVMLQLCLPGEDPHSFMGNRVDPKFDYRELIKLVAEADSMDKSQLLPTHKDAKNIRQGGKVGNLSLQYRTSAPKLMTVARVDYNMDMTLKTAEYIHHVYRQTYRKVPVYWGKQISITKQLGYVETLAGRRVQVRGDWSGSFGWSMGSTAINYRIQGTGGDQKYLAMSVLKDYCTDIGAHFMIDLHDGLYSAVPDAKVAEFCATGKRLLDTLPYEDAWDFSPPIPLPWDCKAGKTWGSLKGVKL